MPDRPVMLPGRGMLWLMRGLALAGLAIALFLLVTDVVGRVRGGLGTVPLCNGMPWLDCDTLLGGRWSAWLGVPVAALAAGVWTAAVILLFKLARLSSELTLRRIGGWLAVVAVVLGGSAVWFTGLQVWMGRWCAWCLAEHVIGAVMAAMLMVHAFGLTRPIRSGAVAWGGVAVALLIGGQVLVEPAYRREVTATAGTWREAGGAVSLMGGAVVLDVARHPLVGRADAPVLVEVLDYTCHHCRLMHDRLAKARAIMGGRAPAVLVVFCPLNSRCNPTVKQTLAFYRHACAVAELAGAVWLTEPDQFEAYDNWLFAHQEGLTAETARRQAERLVGAERLSRVLSDGRAGRLLEANVKLSQVLAATGLPVLMVGDERFTAIPPTAEKLAKELTEALRR